MFKIVTFVFKTGAIAAAALLLGNMIQWEGKTLSDQIKTQLASAERAEITRSVRSWAGTLLNDSKAGANAKPAPKTERKGLEKPLPDEAEEFSRSERQKLRALIQELNRAPRNP